MQWDGDKSQKSQNPGVGLEIYGDGGSEGWDEGQVLAVCVLGLLAVVRKDVAAAQQAYDSLQHGGTVVSALIAPVFEQPLFFRVAVDVQVTPSPAKAHSPQCLVPLWGREMLHPHHVTTSLLSMTAQIAGFCPSPSLGAAYLQGPRHSQPLIWTN